MDGDVRRSDGAFVRFVRVVVVLCRYRQQQLQEKCRSLAKRIRSRRHGPQDDFHAQHSAGLIGAGRGQGQHLSRANQTAEIMEITRRQQAKRSFLFQFRRSLERELSESRIVLIDEGSRIIIRFPGATTFLPGSDQLADWFGPALRRIASIIKATKGRILVSGHTDNAPISTARFRSNWDLSSARAVTVVHYLILDAKVRPDRITAQGFGSSRPLAPNDTPENQSSNRRVEIAIEISSFSE